MTKKYGFEGQLFYGVAGSTAATLLTNAIDISFSTETSKADTTTRGDGSAPPIETEGVVSRKHQIEFTMANDPADAALQSLIAAAAGGTAVALRGKDFASGKGPDGDYVLSEKHGMPMKGAQSRTFTASPTSSAGRTPQLYV